MSRLIILVLLGATLAVGALLVKLGLPVPAALALALTAVGAATLAVERKAERDSPVFGITFMSMGALAGVAGMVKAVPQVNGWVVGIGTLIAEIALLIGVLKGYRKLAGQAGSMLRRRLAERKGWTYAAEAAVPVPGPRSVSRLLAVPNDATSTTGQEVVHGTANGMNFMVFDRRRPNDSNSEPQTVWIVQLPVALPWLLASYLDYLKQEEGAADPSANLRAQLMGLPEVRPGQPQDHTDQPEFGRVLFTPEVRRIVATPDFPRRWWIEGNCLCSTWDGAVAGPKDVEQQVDLLTGLAARFPWPALTGTPS
ncbi:membrane protein implicated in regulation of membrane protease activity [Actinoplanes octamycinicus]|uniref:Membrane protein implicated in regulation of membrane protease activity n=1 Tax=Actinoplanes octamycinicus TaxID=135948 RepID=A0A7W7MCL2_9ACTN|nr:hypothetical protein [Actinoplanes octamycinicus]MBB4745218.1 membrane protein implicated in regulation of membrane protease activity [Actinoplanes octamycinicus]GIE62655.1 hypothetical protein Aoc01nite_80570 [Actinoplanes octamycinicus]